MKNTDQNQLGFTLLEVVLVIVAACILAGIILLIINSNNPIERARDDERRSEINAILNAVYQYALDNNGSIPSSITNVKTEICQTAAVCTDLIDLSVLTKDAKYMNAIPEDPVDSSVNGVGYHIQRLADGRVTVSAPDFGQNVIISMTR